jgi:hypothetical protein
MSKNLKNQNFYVLEKLKKSKKQNTSKGQTYEDYGIKNKDGLMQAEINCS